MREDLGGLLDIEEAGGLERGLGGGGDLEAFGALLLERGEGVDVGLELLAELGDSGGVKISRSVSGGEERRLEKGRRARRVRAEARLNVDSLLLQIRNLSLKTLPFRLRLHLVLLHRVDHLVQPVHLGVPSLHILRQLDLLLLDREQLLLDLVELVDQKVVLRLERVLP